MRGDELTIEYNGSEPQRGDELTIEYNGSEG